jgi:MoaA/NifB/PqqE/SkfB family radical SAM enzyme
MHKKSGGIVINPGCKLACVFCGGRKKMTDSELREEEINAYKNLRDFKREGVEKIAISGSDPIEYEKITELIQYIREQGFRSVHLSTHGTRLADSSFFNKFIKSGINELRMPIYGSNAKIHDSLTQTPGSFNKIVSGVKRLLKKAPEIKIQISCLIMEQNKKDLLNVVDFVNSLGIKNFYFSVPCLVELAKKDYSFYVSFKNLPSHIRKLYKYALKVNDDIKFLEIPFCIFGELNLKNIDNQCYPPNLGKYNQPPGKLRTSIPSLPSYRLKKKVNICKGCRAFNYCDGFFVNDIDKFGVGKIQKL